MPVFPNSIDLPASGLRRAGAVPMSQAWAKNETTLGDLADWLNPAGPIHATSLAENGFAADLDPSTGAKVGGGTPTDNAPALDSFLATAADLNPASLLLDGAGVEIADALNLPAAGDVTIEGLGPATVVRVRSGSNCHAIQSASVGTTDASRRAAWYPSSPVAVTGGRVTLRNFTIDGNHGTYPSGNSDGTPDGTLAAPTDPGDARGPYANDTAGNITWLTTLFLVGQDGVTIENVVFKDSPSYSLTAHGCRNGTVVGCTFWQTVAGRLNTDAVHLNGGCLNWRIGFCHFVNIADDCLAVNLDEGDGTGGTTIVATGCTFDACYTALRVYGYAAHASHVQLLGATGTFQVGLGIVGTAVGNPVSGLADATHQVTYGDFDVALLNGAAYVVNQLQNAGHVTVRGRVAVGGSTPLPVYKLAAGAASNVDIDVTVQRSDFTGAAGCVVVASNPGNDFGHAGTVAVRFRSVSQFGKTFPALPALVSLTGVQSIERLILEAIDAPDAPTVLAVAGSAYVRRVGGADAAKAGPISDAQALPGTHYQSADLGGPAWKDGRGNVFDFTTATVKPKIESLNTGLWLSLPGTDLADHSGFRRSVTGVGSPTVSGGKITLNGTTQYVKFGNTPLTAYGLPNYEWHFNQPWGVLIRPTPAGVAAAFKPLLSCWGQGGGPPNSYVFIAAKNNADFNLYSQPSPGSPVTIAGAFSAGVKTAVWVGSNGTNLYVYAGASGPQTIASPTLGTGHDSGLDFDIQLGADTSDAGFFDGSVEDVVVVTGREITAGEWAAYRAATSPVL